jgi:DNA gyrase/topoisomerase IV subunit A
LIQAFRLSDRQAEDILEIRLRQLARLEAIKIQQELAELRKEKAGLHDLLDNPASMKKTLIKEIEADAKQFGDARRTLIEEAVRASVEQKVVDEPVTVVISDKGWCAPALVTDMKPASSRSRRVTACMARLNAARLIIYWYLARTASLFCRGRRPARRAWRWRANYNADRSRSRYQDSALLRGQQ